MPEVVGTTPTPENKPVGKATPAAATPAAATPAAVAAAKPKKENKYPETAKIRWGKNYKKENPKRKGSTAFKKFGLYRDGMTVQDFRRAAKKVPELRNRLSLNWDIEHGFIRLER